MEGEEKKLEKKETTIRDFVRNYRRYFPYPTTVYNRYNVIGYWIPIEVTKKGEGEDKDNEVLNE